MKNPSTKTINPTTTESEIVLTYEDIAYKVYDFLHNTYAVDHCEVTDAVISALEKLENC